MLKPNTNTQIHKYKVQIHKEIHSAQCVRPTVSKPIQIQSLLTITLCGPAGACNCAIGTPWMRRMEIIDTQIKHANTQIQHANTQIQHANT